MRLAAHPRHLLKRDVKALELAINFKTAPRCHVAFWHEREVLTRAANVG
jgi:hypothetical protein